MDIAQLWDLILIEGSRGFGFAPNSCFKNKWKNHFITLIPCLVKNGNLQVICVHSFKKVVYRANCKSTNRSSPPRRRRVRVGGMVP